MIIIIIITRILITMIWESGMKMKYCINIQVKDWDIIHYLLYKSISQISIKNIVDFFPLKHTNNN